MPFVAISGTFHVKGYSPDGDSIRFKANNPANWSRLTGPSPKLNGQEHAQLRLEAIDTLETHFGNSHQPLLLADAAMSRLLVLVGISNVVWNPSHTLVSDADDGTQGYILAREVEKNRRPVSFAYAGANTHGDGGTVHLDQNLLTASVNYALLYEGLAYPTFYQGLFSDLRSAMAAAAVAARNSSTGLWAADATVSGFDVSNPGDLSTDIVILPKLFRRLAEYFETGGSVTGFKAFLESGNEGVTVLPQGHFTHIDNIVEVVGNVVRMTVQPENLVFSG
jgi:endonuclease YncB( thermonuclease family)